MVYGERFYQMSNAIFHYDLTPVEFMVYSYLVCCAGRKGMCWPSMHRIAVNCNCSKNTVRKAIDALVKKRFIRRVATYEDWQDGRSRQTNNTYYILDLLPVKSTAATTPAKRYRQAESTAPPQPPP